MIYNYKTKQTCSSAIEIEIGDDDLLLRSVKFTGGCNGNLAGITKLVTGMNAADAAERLGGIKCGSKSTSCPDQLATAIRDALLEISKKTGEAE